MLFPTSVVGSMPRSQFVRDLLAPGMRSSLSDEVFERRLDTAQRLIPRVVARACGRAVGAANCRSPERGRAFLG